MNINLLLDLCETAPFITRKALPNATALYLDHDSDQGEMLFYHLFPGIDLALILIDAARWPAPDLDSTAVSSPAPEAPFIINYCIEGRCELLLNNEKYVYLTKNQLSLTECYAQGEYIYPQHHYVGLEFFLDLETLARDSSFLMEHLDLHAADLIARCCPGNETYIASASEELKAVFLELFSLTTARDPKLFHSIQLNALTLLDRLLHGQPLKPSQSCTFYTKGQISIAKASHDLLTEDLRKHHPAKELADRFGISETSLKNYFRGVYGENLSDYMRSVRMNKAADLLLTTRLSVAQISEQVGYQNQSKFASNFKRCFHLSPLAYRRNHRIAERKGNALPE